MSRKSPSWAERRSWIVQHIAGKSYSQLAKDGHWDRRTIRKYVQETNLMCPMSGEKCMTVACALANRCFAVETQWIN